MHYPSLHINYNRYCKSAPTGTISPYPELRVHSGHTSMSVGTSTTIYPKPFLTVNTQSYILQTGSIYTTSHYQNFISEQLISGRWWNQWAWSCVFPSLPEDEEQTTIININFGPEDHQISNLQTSYAKAVAKVIGRSEDVLKLDTIRIQMKSNSSCCSTMSEEHDRETQQNRGSWETILLSGQAHI